MTITQARPLGPDDLDQSMSQRTLFGHPTGLFTLFFAEMWERFSFYGMKALLLYYMTKSFLGYNDTRAYGVQGAYASLVYMTPFFGGILADRLLGQRRAVIIGGLLMAAGHLLMTVENSVAFFTALSLLVCGNGFFKPNISTIVGSLYPKDSPKKDGGFTIFYMGINLGAAIAPVICGYVGETIGWHWGFGLATVGMLTGVAVFAAPTRLTQALIVAGALGGGIGMPMLWNNYLQLIVGVCLAAALLIAGAVSVIALHRGGLPKEAGRAPDPEALRRKVGGLLRADILVYLGIAASIPIVALLVRRDSIAGAALSLTGAVALGFLVYHAFWRSQRIERDRLLVVLILMAFSLVFWTFFEQSSLSVNNFTDRNVVRTNESRRVGESELGSTLKFRVPLTTDRADLAALPLLSQAQLGYKNNGQVFTMSTLAELREKDKEGELKPDQQVITWPVTRDVIGMGIASSETPASEFQAVNPVYILLFGLVFSALWSILAKRNLDPSTPVKFSLGLVQLAFGFVVLWYGTRVADARGMVALSWLMLFYLFITTGELCLSPVGLSMVTKLSPQKIVSTVMGAWFLATAVSEWLAGQLAKLTSVSGEDGHGQYIPPPLDTVHVYGAFFLKLAFVGIAAALVCLALSPLLKRWMHEGVEAQDPPPAQPGGFPLQQST